MEILAAFLAKIFIWGALFGHDTDTSTVLPDLANVALHEKSRDIVSNVNCAIDLIFFGFFGLFGDTLRRWRSGIVVKAAYAADSLIIFLDLVAIAHFDGVSSGVSKSVLVLSAFAAAEEVGIFEVFEGFGGERGARGGFA